MNDFVSAEELLQACSKRNNGEEICRLIGIPTWHKDCDGFSYELGCGGIAYRHRDGFRWSNGKWLTKRECKRYSVQPGIMNV